MEIVSSIGRVSGASANDCHFLAHRYDGKYGLQDDVSEGWVIQVHDNMLHPVYRTAATFSGLWRSPTGHVFVVNRNIASVNRNPAPRAAPFEQFTPSLHAARRVRSSRSLRRDLGGWSREAGDVPLGRRHLASDEVPQGICAHPARYAPRSPLRRRRLGDDREMGWNGLERAESSNARLGHRHRRGERRGDVRDGARQSPLRHGDRNALEVDHQRGDREGPRLSPRLTGGDVLLGAGLFAIDRLHLALAVEDLLMASKGYDCGC
jgi:hypothetical protein